MLLEPFMSDRSVQLPSPSFADAVGPVAVKRILEAALLTRPDPIPLSELKKLFEELNRLAERPDLLAGTIWTVNKDVQVLMPVGQYVQADIH